MIFLLFGLFEILEVLKILQRFETAEGFKRFKLFETVEIQDVAGVGESLNIAETAVVYYDGVAVRSCVDCGVTVGMGVVGHRWIKAVDFNQVILNAENVGTFFTAAF